jgi:hypothetical protein
MTVALAGHGDVACFSFNHHGTFFSDRFDITLARGGSAHSACVGLGLERLAVALIGRYGVDTAQWPPDIASHLFERTDDTG